MTRVLTPCSATRRRSGSILVTTFLPLHVFLWVLLTVAGGCGTLQIANQPLTHWDPSYGYRARNDEPRGMGDVLLVLAFSGGGTRAAALAYGVLEELRDTRIPVRGVDERLLDEVDLITSVSGGSFTAAYYGLFGDRTFADFEERFLRRNLQRQLVLSLLSPLNWIRLAGSTLNRSELAIRLYDREIFDHKTFEDLKAANGPLLRINATDIVAGNHFTFFQPQFDLMCSDLSSLEVARAVAASSAVPGPFTPIMLRSYAGTCGVERPAWLDDALRDHRGSKRRVRYAETVDNYLNGKSPYVYLVDGGVSDNLGLRGPLDDILLVGGIRKRLEQLGGRRPSHIAVIVVNAEVHPEPEYAYSFAGPSLGAMFSAVSGLQIYSYNFETLELTRQSLKEWALEIPPGEAGERVETYMPEVAFDKIESSEQRRFFNALPTTFNLDDDEVDRLIAVGRRLLRESPDFRRLTANLSAQAGTAAQ